MPTAQLNEAQYVEAANYLTQITHLKWAYKKIEEKGKEEITLVAQQEIPRNQYSGHSEAEAALQVSISEEMGVPAMRLYILVEVGNLDRRVRAAETQTANFTIRDPFAICALLHHKNGEVIPLQLNPLLCEHAAQEVNRRTSLSWVAEKYSQYFRGSISVTVDIDSAIRGFSGEVQRLLITLKENCQENFDFEVQYHTKPVLTSEECDETKVSITISNPMQLFWLARADTIASQRSSSTAATLLKRVSAQDFKKISCLSLLDKQIGMIVLMMLYPDKCFDEANTLAPALTLTGEEGLTLWFHHQEIPGCDVQNLCNLFNKLGIKADFSVQASGDTSSGYCNVINIPSHKNVKMLLRYVYDVSENDIASLYKKHSLQSFYENNFIAPKVESESQKKLEAFGKIYLALYSGENPTPKGGHAKTIEANELAYARNPFTLQLMTLKEIDAVEAVVQKTEKGSMPRKALKLTNQHYQQCSGGNSVLLNAIYWQAYRNSPQGSGVRFFEKNGSSQPVEIKETDHAKISEAKKSNTLEMRIDPNHSLYESRLENIKISLTQNIHSN